MTNEALRHYPEPEPVAPLSLDELEAKARQEIAKTAAIVVRGFDGLREKTAARQRVNAALDDFNAAREVAALEEALTEEA